jgi:hypothetical protein
MQWFVDRRIFSLIRLTKCCAEPHHFDTAPALGGKNVVASAPAPFPGFMWSKICKFDAAPAPARNMVRPKLRNTAPDIHSGSLPDSIDCCKLKSFFLTDSDIDS